MMRHKPDRADLERRLGHAFARPGLLSVALTHVSAASGDPAGNNQRLEFLGDRVLGLAVADMLYRAAPDASEGELSHRLSALVRREACAEVAAAWDLAPHLVLGSGEGRSGGRRKAAILADAAEAVIGAIYLDGGFSAAQAAVQRALGDRADAAPRRDPKTALQEWAQGDGLSLPAYAIVERTGPDHAPSFRVSVAVTGRPTATAAGPSRRVAEQEAARAMLVREGVWPDDDDPSPGGPSTGEPLGREGEDADVG